MSCLSYYLFVILSVRLYASYADQKVFVQQIGSHSSGLNGFKTEKDAKVVAQHNDRLEILYGKYPYKLEFNPPPARSISVTCPKKRPLVSDAESNEGGKDKKLKKDLDLDSNEDSFHMNLSGSCSDSQGDNIPKLDKDSAMAKNYEEMESKTVSDTSKNLKPTEEETWEEFGKGTCLVYTSKGIQGRSKVSFKKFNLIPPYEDFWSA